jgi:ribosomal protein S27AE
VQTDFRAHLCPSRQPVIIDAARDLMIRMSQGCPRCSAAGFGEEKSIPGRLCIDCGAPTDDALAHRWVCPTCGFDESRPIQGELADPSHCSWCNP